MYGTLKPGGTYWRDYCEHTVRQIHPAKVRGHLYALPAGYPALVKAEDGPWASGYLLQLKHLDHLAAFDKLEGYAADRTLERNEYYREFCPIYAESGRGFGRAWVYYMTLDRVRSERGILLEEGYWDEALHTRNF